MSTSFNFRFTDTNLWLSSFVKDLFWVTQTSLAFSNKGRVGSFLDFRRYGISQKNHTGLKCPKCKYVGPTLNYWVMELFSFNLVSNCSCHLVYHHLWKCFGSIGRSCFVNNYPYNNNYYYNNFHNNYSCTSPTDLQPKRTWGPNRYLWSLRNGKMF